MTELENFINWIRESEKIVDAEFSKGFKKVGGFVPEKLHDTLLQNYFAYKIYGSAKNLVWAVLLLSIATIILNILTLFLALR